MFKTLNPKPNFDEIELAVLDLWRNKDVLSKSINQRPDSNIRTFYDGPITANGEAHYGHVLTFAMKDVFPRFWSMQGFKVSRSMGWDCQGLPVEIEVEKLQGIKQKSEIEELGIAKFNELCRNLVEEKRPAILELEERIGRLVNSEEEYATMDADYIESVWWSLKELYEKGLLYEGFKVVPYSTKAGTSLSNAEVGLGGYKSFVDPAVTVKFPLKENPGVSLLAWTTTPWTLPGNLGLAVGENITYSRAKLEGETEEFIVAQELLNTVFKDREFVVLDSFSGQSLIGKEYLPPFEYYRGRQNAHKIYAGSHVTTESGTGIVHLAPYGAEDNDIFMQVGIESFDYLNEEGEFKSEISEYAGQFYRQANKNIIADLTEKRLMFKHEDYEHELPICWRTGVPLIYKPILSWYVAVTKIKAQLIAENDKVNWHPEHFKNGRFGNWLQDLKDWGISRSRYWGTPLPVWKSTSGKVKLIGSFAELKELSGVQVSDPHRPYVDDIKFTIDGDEYTRVLDVIDVWYDSGSMPFARFHYPFENKEKFEAKFPAEYIAEGIDQTRGWFYSLLAVNTALFGKAPYKNVVVNGTATDEQGAKLSKSKKNYSSPSAMIKNLGADSVRAYFASTPISYGEDTAVTEDKVRLTAQELTLSLYNSVSYLITYANLHNFEPEADLAQNNRLHFGDDHPWNHIPFADVANELDAWLLVLLQQTIGEVTLQLEKFNQPKAMQAIQKFVNEISKWYIRRSRNRFASGDLRAISTLYYCVIELCKLLAPIMPFLTEHFYQILAAEMHTDLPESIHLTDYPVVDLKFLTEYQKLIPEMELTRVICELGKNIRSTNGLKVRQPLRTMHIQFSLNDNMAGIALNRWMEDLIRDELNVKDVSEVPAITDKDGWFVIENSAIGIKIALDSNLDQELIAEGNIREFVRNIQGLRKEMGMALGEKVKLSFFTQDAEILNTILQAAEDIKISASLSDILEDAELLNSETPEVDVNGVAVRVKIWA